MKSLLLDPPLASCSVLVIGTVDKVLMLHKIGQHLAPTLATISGLRPSLVIVRLTPHVNHCINRRAAPEHLAARISKRSVAQSGFNVRLIAPVRSWIVDAV